LLAADVLLYLFRERNLRENRERELEREERERNDANLLSLSSGVLVKVLREKL
jgi:Na+/H+ antiporter NhaD/arsenite permease-like protein